MVMVLASIGWLMLWRAHGAKLFSVQSDSMAPTFNKGDLLIDIKATPQSIKPGDVISYLSLQNSGEIVTHRVVSLNYAKGYFITKGDNLAQPDPQVPLNRLTGKTVKAVPKLGYLFDQLYKPLGLLTFIYLPAALIVITELWLLTGQYKYQPYQLI